MIARIFAAGLAAIALSLAACAQDSGSSPAKPAATAANTDPAACAAAGGELKPVCRLQRPMCVVSYADAGKVCTDDKQCQGGCLYDGAPVGADGKTTGICRKDNDPCGCRESLKDGKRVNGICVD